MTPHFLAKISLIPTEEGGLKSQLPLEKWRTVLEINGSYWSARLTFEGDPKPGSTFPALVQLLVEEAALPYFFPEAEFRVWSGGTKGYGRVLSMCPWE